MLFTQFNLEDAKEVWQEEAMERGIQQGITQGEWIALVRNIDAFRKNLHMSLEEACRGAGVSVEEYEQAKRRLEG